MKQIKRSKIDSKNNNYKIKINKYYKWVTGNSIDQTMELK